MLKVTAYKSFGQPILEYACTVWNPHTKQNVKRIEAVQRRAAQFITNWYYSTLSVKEMVDRLECSSLQHHRKVAMVY